jgi:hypothetical protein
MPLQLIGAGLGRTGTASLKVALEELGLNKCYHMAEVMLNPSHMQLWTDAADGNADWERIFDGYAAGVDYPVCAFWRELAEYYPSAKVLLSVRDAERWFESTQATIFSPRFREWAQGTPFGVMGEKIVYADFGDRIEDRDFMVGYFERRVAEIKTAIPVDRLLVHEVQQGWAPLCEFLDVPVPDKPFPRVNSREETAQFIETLMSSSTDGTIGTEVQDRVGVLLDESADNAR